MFPPFSPRFVCALALLVLWCGAESTDAFGAREPDNAREAIDAQGGTGKAVDMDAPDLARKASAVETCRTQTTPRLANPNEAQRPSSLEQGKPVSARASATQRAGNAERIVSGPATPDESGKELYRKACATCHGADGRGAPATLLGFDVPLPDFTDCNFASREPDADWIAVAHQGGPVRGFAREMPAFGEALTQDELQKILDHIRTLCPDDDWPRGELNAPRALVMEKAFPEDEVVLTTTANLETGNALVIHELHYEKRFGARNQFEIAALFGFGEHTNGGVLGDVAFGLKRVVLHKIERGNILSLGGEVILPAGRRSADFGEGVTRLEPFVSFGQILAGDAFLQFQGGLEISLDRNAAEPDAFFRGVAGKSFTQGDWGRTWSPMLEVLGARAGRGGVLHWDIAPQVQIALNQRQHVMLNVGLRMPVNRDDRMQGMIYLLWEWFDGGFFEGW